MGKDSLNESYGYIMVKQKSGNAQNCTDSSNDNYVQLSLYKYEKEINMEGWVVQSFRVTPDYKLIPGWKHYRNDGTVMPISHMVRTYSEYNGPGLVIFVVHDPHQSNLVLLNSETGQLVDQIKFHGNVKNTMPLVIGDEKYLSAGERLVVLKELQNSEIFIALWPGPAVIFKFIGKQISKVAIF